MNRTFNLAAAVAVLAGVVLVFGLRGGAGGLFSVDGKDDGREKAVRAVLDGQAAAWNRGDIEGFMDGYERSDQTLFVSGGEVTRGWQTVLERYRRNYDSREKMGTLAFSELEIKPLSEYYTLAVGRWQLTRANDLPHGRFTLLFRRTPKGWRVVHDHTSSASK
ncbi:MAG: YybH family protein [Pyrinomonadaceae bacterium]